MPGGGRVMVRAARLIGEAPVTARETLYADWMETPLGPMLAVGDSTHLHRLEFHDHDEPVSEMNGLRRRTHAPVLAGRTAPIEQIDAELKAYFAGESGDFRTPLHLAGSAFERAVWEKLLEVPLGETCSYGDIARAVDTLQAVRAVARANGSNCIPIVIPCHRCIGSDGSLTGYGGGLWRKQWLLRHEGRMRPVGLFAEERS